MDVAVGILLTLLLLVVVVELSVCLLRKMNQLLLEDCRPALRNRQKFHSITFTSEPIMSQSECRTKHPWTKHPMPFFATPDKTSHINLPPRTKHPMQFLSPRTKHPMPFLPPRTKHPMLLLPPRTKHPTLCLKPMKVHKTAHLVNCHYYC